MRQSKIQSKIQSKSVNINENISEVYFHLWITLGRVRHAIYKAREIELKSLDISPEQSAVIYIIYHLKGQATQAEISRWLFRKPNTVSAILKVMERKSLIKKTKDDVVTNLLRISLTEKGRGIFLKTLKHQSIDNIISIFSRQECDYFQLCLDKLLARSAKEINVSKIRVMTSRERS